MLIYDINIPELSLSNLDLIHYPRELNIPNFRGVIMRNTLPKKPYRKECRIVNLKNTSYRPRNNVKIIGGHDVPQSIFLGGH